MPLPDPNRPSGPNPAPNAGTQNLPQGQSAAPPPLPTRTPSAASRSVPGYVPPLPGSNAAAGMIGSAPTASTPPPHGKASSFTTRHVLWLVLGVVVLLGVVGIAGGAWVVVKMRDSARKMSLGDRNHDVAPLPADTVHGVVVTQPARTTQPQRSPVASQPAAPLPAVGITCQGVFTYNDPTRPHRTPFAFTFNDVSPPDAATGQVRVAGTMNEARVDFGPPGMKTLPSTFSGTWTPTREGARIAFTKAYTFESHPSEFVGAYDPTTRTVTGTWDLNGYAGAFTLMDVTTR